MKIPQMDIDGDRDNKYKKYFKYTENERLSVIRGYVFDKYTQKDLDIEILGTNPDSHKGRESNNIIRYIGLNRQFRGLFSGMSLQRSILELKSTKDSQYDELISILKLLKCKKLHSNPTIWSMNISTREDYEESWNLFKNNSCISIDYLIEDKSTDYSRFETQEEIMEYLGDENSNKSRLIYGFVSDIEKGDIFIANMGSKVLSGIGIVESEYIHQNEELCNIRKISWFYTPDDLKISDDDFFNTNNIVMLNESYSNFINELLARIASKDKKIRINLFKFLFNKFYEEFHSKEIGKDHFRRYESSAQKIQNEWNNLKEKKANGENWCDDFWNNIFHRDLELFTVGGNSLRNMIQSKSRNTHNFSDDDMDNLANEFFTTANSLLNEKDIDKQKEILEAYSSDALKSYGFQTGVMSPVLFYLDESEFYPINRKTIKTVRFLSIILDNEIILSDKLNEYIDSNEQYKNFLKNLKNEFYFDKLNISDIKVFDEFCHWFCDKELGYYVDKKNKIVNIFPVKEIFKYNIMRLNMFESEKPRNLIYFGAPGTGKSFCLNENKDELEDCIFERVTFHPDYSYANFVGTYKPVPKDEDKISYEYVPGPFMRILASAYSEPTKPFLLIIEEINRANVAAVFGDVFQLLDRDDDGKSRFPIQTSEDMRQYLKDKLGDCEYVEDFSTIEIPPNLFIWATMNSADQGVFPMDTAFKRRWDFKYLGINAGSEKIKNIKINWESHKNWKRFKEDKNSWDEIRITINDELSENGINEDKLLGPFFAFTEYIKPDGNNDVDLEDFITIFRDKILMYLFEDVAKYKKNLFYNENLSYSQLRDEFDDKGFKIFCKTIQNKLLEDNDE